MDATECRNLLVESLNLTIHLRVMNRVRLNVVMGNCDKRSFVVHMELDRDFGERGFPNHVFTVEILFVYSWLTFGYANFADASYPRLTSANINESQIVDMLVCVYIDLYHIEIIFSDDAGRGFRFP